MRPYIIYVSGAPGSGKTTLAAKISAELYIPHISSDLIHGGVHATQGRVHDRNKSLHEVFVPLMIDYAERGVSFVVDHVLQRGLSENDILAKLEPVATIVYVHTICHDPIGRHLARELDRKDSGQVLDESSLIERSEYHRQNLDNTQHRLPVALASLEVNTDNGYEPSLPEIVAFINRNTGGNHAESN